MHAIGIEIDKDCWKITHIEGGLLGFKLRAFFTIAAGTNLEKAAAVKKMISDAGAADARITIGLDRFNSITKILSLPAPNQESVEGMLKFEFEKHIPFTIESANYGFQIIDSKKGAHTVALAASKKEVTAKILEVFRGAGLVPGGIVSDKLALYNALGFLKKIPKDKCLTSMHIKDHLVTIETFNKSIPVDSRFIKKNKGGEWIKAVARELKFAELSAKAQTGIKPEQIILLSDELIDESTISALKSCVEAQLILDAFKLPDGSAIKSLVSFGLALRSLEKGPLELNMFTVENRIDGLKALAFNFKYAAAAVVFGIVTGVSYLIQDNLVLSRLDSAIAQTEAKGDDVKGLKMKLKSIDQRILDLERTDYRSVESLAVLNGLASNLPKGTWITGFDLTEAGISIEGYSEQASSLLLSLEQSGFVTEAEFSGPVTKTAEGRERFRLKAKIKSGVGQA